MSEIWFEEVLLPDLDTMEFESKGTKPDIHPQINISSSIRLTIPRTKILGQAEIDRMAIPTRNYKYVLVRLGCEFDPTPGAREEELSFDSAVLQVFIHGNGAKSPRVYNLAPIEFDQGKPWEL